MFVCHPARFLGKPTHRRVSSKTKVFVIDPYTRHLFVLGKNVLPAVDGFTVWGGDFIVGLIRWEDILNQKATFNWN